MEVARIPGIKLDNGPHRGDCRKRDAVVRRHAGWPGKDFLRIVTVKKVRAVAAGITQLGKSTPTNLSLNIEVPAFVISRLVAEVPANDPRVDRNESRGCERLSGRWCRERLGQARDVGEGACRWVGFDCGGVLRVRPGHV